MAQLDNWGRHRARMFIAEALKATGWKLHFYREPSPPTAVYESDGGEWAGVAEKSGFILVVGRHSKRYINLESGPDFLVNPPKVQWHIQRDGKIVRSGKQLGWTDLAYGKKEARAKEWAERWNALIAVQPMRAGGCDFKTAQDGTKEIFIVEPGITAQVYKNELGKLEVRFSEKPSYELRQAMGRYGRYNMRFARGGWYRGWDQGTYDSLCAWFAQLQGAIVVAEEKPPAESDVAEEASTIVTSEPAEIPQEPARPTAEIRKSADSAQVKIEQLPGRGREGKGVTRVSQGTKVIAQGEEFDLSQLGLGL